MATPRSHRGATRVSLVALSVAATIAAGCGLVTPDASPAASGAADLIIGVRNLPLLVGNLEADVLTDHLTYNGLYRYDETYQVLPDLADGLCQQSTDQLTLTCHLRTATFHDGSAVSSKDVAFTYELASSDQCR